MPFLKQKTGLLAILLLKLCFFRPQIAFTGQQFFSGKLKMSTNSFFAALLFGCFTWIRIEFSRNLMSSQVRHERGSKQSGLEAKISPTLNPPKNIMQQADQNTLLLSESQLLIAIPWPISFRRERVITFLFLVSNSDWNSRFLQPFKAIFVA